MSDPTAPETLPEESAGLDIEATADDIVDSMNLLPEEPEPAPVAAAPKGDESATPAAPVLAPEVPAAAEAKPAEPAPAEEVPPPKAWRKEAQEAWKDISPVVKEELVKRERDILSYVEQVKTPVAIGNQMSKIVEPYMEMFSKSGINVFDNYAATLQVQKALAYGSPQEKLTVLQQLAQSAGIQLQGDQLTAPPAAEQQYVAQLEQRLAALEGRTQQVSSVVQSARVAELEKGIMDFLTDTERHPYGMELADDITQLIQKGIATNLEDAYNHAVVANPVTRQKSLDAEMQKRMTATAVADAAKVEAARKASSANVRSTVSRRAAQPTGTIDDTLAEALAAINARAH